MASSTLRRSIGPGILLAGACIGGSHLMSSTTAGARFGFALVGLILLTNLIKYPFLRVGTRFTAATGLSLLEGFQKRNPLYLPLYLVVSLVTGTFTIAAVSFVAGLLLTNIPLLAGLDPYGLSIAVLAVSGLVLLLGHYRALDRLSKLLVVLLTLLGGGGCITADPRPRRRCGGQLGQHRSQPLDPGQPGLPDSPDGLDARTGGDVRVAVVVDVLPCARHRAHRNAKGGRVRFQPRLWRHRGDGDVLRDLGRLHDVRQR
ncbi:Mn2+/Fe2+ transporter/ NRAMP family [Synechococcus sp. RS9902]|nr:Mn2+/Fe2+ transporter/ NRAMP family [Synechococcus sp. RS9902]